MVEERGHLSLDGVRQWRSECRSQTGVTLIFSFAQGQSDISASAEGAMDQQQASDYSQYYADYAAYYGAYGASPYGAYGAYPGTLLC